MFSHIQASIDKVLMYKHKFADEPTVNSIVANMRKELIGGGVTFFGGLVFLSVIKEILNSLDTMSSLKERSDGIENALEIYSSGIENINYLANQCSILKRASENFKSKDDKIILAEFIFNVEELVSKVKGLGDILNQELKDSRYRVVKRAPAQAGGGGAPLEPLSFEKVAVAAASSHEEKAVRPGSLSAALKRQPPEKQQDSTEKRNLALLAEFKNLMNDKLLTWQGKMTKLQVDANGCHAVGDIADNVRDAIATVCARVTLLLDELKIKLNTVSTANINEVRSACEEFEGIITPVLKFTDLIDPILVIVRNVEDDDSNSPLKQVIKMAAEAILKMHNGMVSESKKDIKDDFAKLKDDRAIFDEANNSMVSGISQILDKLPKQIPVNKVAYMGQAEVGFFKPKRTVENSLFKMLNEIIQKAKSPKDEAAAEAHRSPSSSRRS